MPYETVRNTVNENEYPAYSEFTDKQVRDMVEEKTKNLSPKEPKHKAGTSIDRLRSEIEKLPQYGDGDGGDFIKLLDVPDAIIDQIVSDSTEKIHTRLEERAYIIEGLTISDQELR